MIVGIFHFHGMNSAPQPSAPPNQHSRQPQVASTDPKPEAVPERSSHIGWDEKERPAQSAGRS
jgi:hypothetical protein